MRYILPVLSCLLLSAHSLRVGDFSFFIIWLIFPILLLFRNGWIRIVFPTALVYGACVWGMAGIRLIRIRLTSGAPWTRLSIIMGISLLIIIFSVFLFVNIKNKRRNDNSEKKAVPLGIIFICTFGLLYIIRIKAPLQMIVADRFLPGTGGIEIFLISLYAVWIGSKMLDPVKLAKVRSGIWLFFSFIFFLQLVLGIMGIKKMLMTGDLHLPVPMVIIAGPLYRGGGFFMLILFLTTLLLAGPAWCSYLCYIGAWDDSMSRLSNTSPKPLPQWITVYRLILLLLTIIIPLILRIFHVGMTIGVTVASVFGIVGVLVMIFLSRKKGLMVHCIAYCPIGMAGNIIGKISPWRIKIDRDCTGCGKCAKACRYNALNKENLDVKSPGISCTLCGDCLVSCKDKYISYYFPTLSSEKSRISFIVLIVIIHTIFLSVARM